MSNSLKLSKVRKLFQTLKRFLTHKLVRNDEAAIKTASINIFRYKFLTFLNSAA